MGLRWGGLFRKDISYPEWTTFVTHSSLLILDHSFWDKATHPPTCDSFVLGFRFGIALSSRSSDVFPSSFILWLCDLTSSRTLDSTVIVKEVELGVGTASAPESSSFA